MLENMVEVENAAKRDGNKNPLGNNLEQSTN